MGNIAEIFGIFYSQWDYEKVKILRVLIFLTWHEFDEFGWNVPYLYVNIYVCIYINYRQKLKIN